MNTKREEFSPLFSECKFRDLDTGEYTEDAHWKNPVRVVVDENDASDYCEAISFFVGGACRIKPVGGGQVAVTNKGYFSNIGA